MAEPIARKASESPYLPWDHVDEWLIWVLVLVVATIFIHNATRAYRVHKGRERP